MSQRNRILQRIGLRNQLRKIAENTVELSQAAHEALSDFDEFYSLTVHAYVSHQNIEVTQTDESGTPILDSVFGFFKWLWESGMLEWLLKIWFGIELPETGSRAFSEQVAGPSFFIADLARLASS